jgi:hypothetical protein
MADNTHHQPDTCLMFVGHVFNVDNNHHHQQLDTCLMFCHHRLDTCLMFVG